MKPNELRIGNLLYKSTEKIVAVESINNNGINLYAVDGDLFVDYIMQELKPIPLTEEWMGKLGFEESKIKIGEDFYLEIEIPSAKKKGIDIFLIQDGSIICLRDTVVEYVHQLQNIYFLLKGEELILK